MNRDQETHRITTWAGARRAWLRPSVVRLEAGAAEVGTRSFNDGPLSSKS
jgi:hypothetical protein